MSINFQATDPPHIELPLSTDRKDPPSIDIKSVDHSIKHETPHQTPKNKPINPNQLVIDTEQDHLLHSGGTGTQANENLISERHPELDDEAHVPIDDAIANSPVKRELVIKIEKESPNAEISPEKPGSLNEVKDPKLLTTEANHENSIFVDTWPVGGNFAKNAGKDLNSLRNSKKGRKSCLMRFADCFKYKRSRKCMLFIMLFTIYADTISTLVSINYFFKNNHENFGAVSLALFLYNLCIRIQYVLKSAPKGDDEYLKVAMTVFLNIDTIMLEYTNQMNPDLAVYVDELSIYKIATDNIPQAMLALYSQILDGVVNDSLMVSMITSLFSLTRQAKIFTFNPLKIYQDISHNSVSYRPENLFEEFMEYFDTTVEMIGRVCLLGAFCYVTKPWGWWIYLVSYTGAYFIYCMVLHPNAPHSKHFWTGLFLAVVYTKGEVFYHPFSNYTKNGKWLPRVLVWDQYKYIFGWKMVQIVSISAPLGLAIKHFDQLNDFTELMFFIGIGCFGYTLLINYIWDLWAIRKIQKQAFEDLCAFLSMNADLIKMQEQKEPNSPDRPNHIHHKTKFQIHFPDFSISNLFYQKLIPVIFKNKLSRNLDFKMKYSNIAPTYGDLIKSFTYILRDTSQQENFLMRIAYIRLKKMEARLEFMDPKRTRIELMRIYDRERGIEEKVNDKQLIKFFDAMLNWKSLRVLTLDFSYCTQFTKKTIDRLAITLWKLAEHLRELNIDFFGAEKNLRDEDLDHLANRGLVNLVNLVKLELNFSMCRRISDVGIDKFSNSFTGLKNLDYLHLDFSLCNKLTDKSLGKLAMGISKLSQLLLLELDFSQCKEVTAIGIEKLSVEGLSKLPQLTQLALNFNQCSKITDHGLDKLSKEALSKLHNLIHLELKFAECIKLSTDGLSKLSNIGLIELSNLDELKLNFHFCPKLNDESVYQIAKGLNTLEKLSQLELNFSCCERISDTGLESIMTRVGGYLNLLVLKFGQCKEITDTGINQIVNNLERLEHLKDLYLSFESCSITWQGVDLFVAKLSQRITERLTKLDLNFDWKFNEQTPDTKVKIQNLLDTVNSKIK